MAKSARGFLKPYNTYVFRDKDPVIDVLRTAVSDSGLSNKEIADEARVSTTTLHNWFKGKTRRPQFATVVATTRAIGSDAIRAVTTLIDKGKK